MNKLAGTLAFLLASMTIAGCNSTNSASAASATPSGSGSASAPASSSSGGSGKPGPANYVKGAPLSSQTTTAQISDPSLNNIVAATLTIPAGWKLEGIMLMSPCTSVPWPVFRSYSVDGLMQYRIEPVIGWNWHTQMKMPAQAGCASISGQISAADFLQYYLGTMQGGVHVVGTMPVPAAYQQWAQNLAAQGNQGASRMTSGLHLQYTADTAALRIEVVNGSFVEEERLRTVVGCMLTNTAPLTGGTCWARVDVLTAPQGQLDALVQVVDSQNLPHGVDTQQWQQAAMARQQQQEKNAMIALTKLEQQENQMIYNQFQQIMQRMQTEHQQFMQQQESQFESAMNNANASMNAQSTSASDWVDYALDQQTVLGPGGQPTKISNDSTMWTNGSQFYVTDGSAANPNGLLPGSWSPTTQVHGNGQPMQ